MGEGGGQSRDMHAGSPAKALRVQPNIPGRKDSKILRLQALYF